ncbi:MAG: hypothetical protein LUH14_03985 [Clostridiaceae bacterium]|nr:hypothetical protein [Clostridiaceae bacterium]
MKNGNQKQYAWIPKEAVFEGKGSRYTASFHPDYLLPVSSEVDGGTRQISVSALRNQKKEQGKHFSFEKMKRLPSKLSRAR